MEDPVVVIGFSFRFPGDAVSEEGFWDIINNGRSTMTEVPDARYDINGYFSHDDGRLDMVSSRLRR
jgi:acyl transferase domain-containing protein